MADVVQPVQYTLNTDPRVNAIINALTSKGFLHPDRPPDPSVRYLTLHCCRPDCRKVFTESSNRANKYMQPIAHMVDHNWDAGHVMQEAVNAALTVISVKRQQGSIEYVSPPPKRVNHRSSAPSTPERSNSALERNGSSLVQDKQQCLEDTAYMVASNCMPFRWFAKPVTRRWIASMGAVIVPTRSEVIAAVNSHGDKALQQVFKHLAESNYPCTLALDSVTNVNHHKIYSVVMLNKGQPWYLGSWTIKHAVDTALNAESMLGPLLLQLRAHNIRVSALTTDNAPVMIQLRQSISSKFWIAGIGCAAHLVHNSAAYLIEELSEELKPFNSLLDQYIVDKRLRHALDIQDASIIKRKNDTRWSSHLYALQSIRRNKDTINALEPGRTRTVITAEDWATLDDIISILQEWEMSNKLMQADSATLMDYYLHMVSLLTHLELLKLNDVKGLSSALVVRNKAAFTHTADYIHHRWANLDCNQIVATTAYIARAKSRELGCEVSTVHNYFKHSAAKMLRSCNIPIPTTGVDKQLVQQLQQMEAQEGKWQLAPGESKKSRTEMLANALNYYDRRSYYEDCMPLAALAVILLTITPSEASVERTFSALKMQWTARRNRLEVSTINNLLHLQLNGDRLRKESDLAVGGRPSAKYWLTSPASNQDDEEESEAAEAEVEP